MIKFDGRIVQFGFGAVGKSFFELIAKEITFDKNKYFVITRWPEEFEFYKKLGGILDNFIIEDITKENFKSIFEQYLRPGDLLIDFSDSIGTNDLCAWCADNNFMYINTGDAEWPEGWLNIFEHNRIMRGIIAENHNNSDANKYPVVLQHGNNPGLVSHFVKAAIDYIARKQRKNDKHLKSLIKQNKFNEAAYLLGIKIIQVNDIDLQKINAGYNEKKMYNTWCADTFFFEMLTEAAFNIGTHEKIDFTDKCKYINTEAGHLEFKKLAAETKCRTYYPRGAFDGFVVPHDETVSIAAHLEVRRKSTGIYQPADCESLSPHLNAEAESSAVAYRPTVLFVYAPSALAAEYIKKAKVNEYPYPDADKPADGTDESGKTIIRGYVYPDDYEIVYDQIVSGTEYVGVLLLGENFDPVWVGNRIEPQYLNRKYYKKRLIWQTPTITPVAASALAAVCWMLKNKKRGIFLPDDLDYKYILKTAEKYISKTIYKTFKKESLNIDFSDLQIKNFIIR